MARTARLKVEGMDEVLNKIKKVGELPQKYVTKAARSAMGIAFRTAKRLAPVKSGELRKGLVMKPERARVKGKKVYQIKFDKLKNPIFQKPYNDGKEIAYYPSAQEHGFYNHWAKRKLPAKRFLKRSIDDNTAKIEKKVIEVMNKEFDKIGGTR